MAAVMIGVDPHKGSHTAVVVSVSEEPLDELWVRACATQAEKLVAWAAAWPERTWAVEGAGGLGRLLAQQLVAAGQRVLDVQPKLASRVRLLQAGDTNKNDPDDALPVAVAALRSRACRQVTADDYPAVLKVWSKRHRDLGRTRNQVACRLHAVLCDLVPGGNSKEISAAQAAKILEQVTPSGAVAQARAELAAEFLADLRRLDAQLRDTRKKLAAAVKDSGTTLTQVFGVGPWSPASSSVTSATWPASPAAITSPPITAPPQLRCPPGTGRPAGCRCAATGASTTRSTWPRSPRSGTGTATAAPITRRSWPRERRTRKRSGPSSGGVSDAIFARLQADARQAAEASVTGPGGQPGNDSASSAAGSHPARQLFGQATPEPATSATAGIPSAPRSSRAESRGRTGHSPVAATLPPAKPQVQVEYPERSEDERPGGGSEATAVLGREEGSGEARTRSRSSTPRSRSRGELTRTRAKTRS